MKKSIHIPEKIRIYWEQFTRQQQAFTVYFLILVGALLFMPIVNINYLDSPQIDTFTIFHAYMGKTATLISVVLLFLIGYNFSNTFKHWLSSIFGVTSSTHLTNAGGLFIILMALFSIGDTVTLIKQSFSSRVGTTSGFLTIGIIVIVGLVWHLMLARIDHKKTHNTKEVSIRQGTDMSGYEPKFEKAKKEVEGLFGAEEI